VSEHLKPIVEALIFASPEPLAPRTLYKLLDGEPKEDVDAALAALRADYERPGGLQIVEIAGGFQIVTRPELHEWVRKLFHDRTTQKLSVQALETLAVIAYKQPVTSVEIAEIRGVTSSGGVLGSKDKGMSGFDLNLMLALSEVIGHLDLLAEEKRLAVSRRGGKLLYRGK